jgi:hypothetical protein
MTSLGRIENKIRGLETRLAELNGEASTPLAYIRREVDLLRDDVRIVNEKLDRILTRLGEKAGDEESEQQAPRP